MFEDCVVCNLQIFKKSLFPAYLQTLDKAVKSLTVTNTLAYYEHYE